MKKTQDQIILTSVMPEVHLQTIVKIGINTRCLLEHRNTLIQSIDGYVLVGMGKEMWRRQNQGQQPGEDDCMNELKDESNVIMKGNVVF